MQGLLGKTRAGQGADAGSRQRADLGAESGPTADIASLVRRGMFDQEGDRSGKFTADGEPLNKTEDGQRDRRGEPDLSIGRQ